MLAAMVLCAALLAGTPDNDAGTPPAPAREGYTRVGPGWRAGVAITALGGATVASALGCWVAGFAVAWTDVVPPTRPGSYAFTANFARMGLSQNFIFLGGVVLAAGLVQVLLGGLTIIADLP